MSEPHTIMGNAQLTGFEARRILRLIDNCEQGLLNGIAREANLVTPETDAATVANRLRDLAQGVLQQEHRMQPK
jgi:hypothetical protein